METMTINKKQMINAKNANDLLDGISASIVKIHQFTEFNDYTLAINPDSEISELIDKSAVEIIKKLSLNKRKELRNYLWTVDNRPNIKGCNRLLRFLNRYLALPEQKIIKSTKELSIQNKRKSYVDARNAAKKAYADYKDEKSDFYKLRLSKGQKI